MHRRHFGRAGVGLVLAAATMQAFPVTGEPLSTASSAVSAAAPGIGEPARVKHDPPPAGDEHASHSADEGRLAFFGYLEFDWNFPGSDGVPGFGPCRIRPRTLC